MSEFHAIIQVMKSLEYGSLLVRMYNTWLSKISTQDEQFLLKINSPDFFNLPVKMNFLKIIFVYEAKQILAKTCAELLFSVALCNKMQFQKYCLVLLDRARCTRFDITVYIRQYHIAARRKRSQYNQLWHLYTFHQKKGLEFAQ